VLLGRLAVVLSLLVIMSAYDPALGGFIGVVAPFCLVYPFFVVPWGTCPLLTAAPDGSA